jgi:hypothetical protein
LIINEVAAVVVVFLGGGFGGTLPWIQRDN